MSKHRAKRLRAGKYLYRGVEITCVGYYPPEQRVCWEGCCIVNGRYCGDYHAFSLAQIKALIDGDLDKE